MRRDGLNVRCWAAVIRRDFLIGLFLPMAAPDGVGVDDFCADGVKMTVDADLTLTGFVCQLNSSGVKGVLHII